MTRQVLHILPHGGGGADTYVDMLERLSAYQHRRIYLSSGRSPAAAAGSIPMRWPCMARSVAGADIVHTHGDVATIMALPVLARRPSVMTTHGLHLLRRSAGVRGRAVAWSTSSAGARLKAIICTSTAERGELEHVLSVPDRPKLWAIPNGVDPNPPVGRSAEDVRYELRVPADTVLGLFVGQLESRKAPLLAASVAEAAQAAGNPFLLAVAGDGPLRADLEALEAGAIRLLGHRADVPDLLGAADLYLQTSEREGMSYALLEAMSHGLPIVAVESPGVSEVIGDAGVMVSSPDPKALAKAVDRLCRGGVQLRAELGSRASARVRDLFSTERFLAATAAVYESLIRGEAAPESHLPGRKRPVRR